MCDKPYKFIDSVENIQYSNQNISGGFFKERKFEFLSIIWILCILSAKSVENLGAFAFKTDQSIDNTFRQINLAVQSL